WRRTPAAERVRKPSERAPDFQILDTQPSRGERSSQFPFLARMRQPHMARWLTQPSDKRNHVRESSEGGERQGIRNAAKIQEGEGKDTDGQRRDDLPSHIAAHNRFQFEQDTRQTEM